MSTQTIDLTDPVYKPKERHTIIERAGLKLIADERDLPFIMLMLTISLTVIPAALYLFWPGNFSWWLVPVYLGLTIGVYFGPFVLMLHNTSHRMLFKTRYRWMSHYIPWVLGPFFGETPDTYYAHHVGMHHPENNLHDDLSCTMQYQRDSVPDFLRYWGRFFLAIVPELAIYLWKRRRFTLFRKMLVGELAYYAVIAGLLFFNWQATLAVFLIPFFCARFAMMAGNWAQHAFLDGEAPGNCYRNSITCINCTYNRRCFNDGYHIGHHLKANRHWTEMPGDFLSNHETYAREGAIVFQGIDFFVIWFLLMTKSYSVLADHYVDLREENPSREEIIGLLKERTRRIVTP